MNWKIIDIELGRNFYEMLWIEFFVPFLSWLNNYACALKFVVIEDESYDLIKVSNYEEF